MIEIWLKIMIGAAIEVFMVIVGAAIAANGSPIIGAALIVVAMVIAVVWFIYW